MPNHVRSVVQIGGLTNEEINELSVNLSDETEESNSGFLNAYLPEPDSGPEPSTLRGWRIENWGTKWDVYDVDIHPAPPRCFMVSFNTAWEPPSENFYRALSARYPNAYFSSQYEDEFLNFVGVTVAQDGIAFDRRIDPDVWMPKHLQGNGEDPVLRAVMVDPETGEEMGDLFPTPDPPPVKETLSKEEAELVTERGMKWMEDSLQALMNLLPKRN